MESNNINYADLLLKITLLENELAEQKKRRYKERINEILFKTLVEKSTEALMLIDEQGRVEYASPSAFSVLGYTSEELHGMHFSNVTHPEDHSFLSGHFEKILSHPGQNIKIIARQRHKTGRYIWTEGSATNQLNDPVINAIVLNFYEITERKEVEDKLHESENRFAALFHSNPVGAIFTRLTDGLVIDANKAFLTMFKHDRDRVIGKTTAEIGVFADLHDRERLIGKLKGGERIYNEEVRFRKSTGETGQLLLSAEVLHLEGMPYLLSMMNDITQSKNAERQILDTNNKFANAQQIAHIGSWEDHLPTGELTWSDEMYRIMGFQPGTPMDLISATSVFPPGELKRFTDAMNDCLNEGKPFSMDYRIIRPDGLERFIHDEGVIIRDENGNPLRMFGTTQDITGRKLAEEKLLSTEKYFRTLIEKAPDGIVLIGPDGKMQYASPSARKIFGYPEDLGNYPDPNENTHPEDLPRVLENLNHIIQNPGEVVTIEYRFKSTDNSYRWIESTFRNLFQEKSIQSIVINFRDINDKKLADQALKNSEERYRKLAENLPDTTVAFLDKSLTITFVTGKEIKDSGRASGNFTGRAFIEVFGPANYEKLAPLFRQAFLGKTGTSDFELKNQHFHLIIVPILENDGSINEIQLISQNITERLLVEKLRNQWADAFYNCGHGIAIGLPDSDTLLTCNQAFANLQGYSIGEISNTPVLRMYTPESRSYVKDCIAEADRTGHKQYETLMVRKDGTTYPVLMDVVSVRDDKGNILYRVATQQDISERKKAEEKIRLSEIRYRYVFDNNPLPMWAYDLETLQFLAVNEVAILKYGYSRDEFLKLNITDVILNPENEHDNSLLTDPAQHILHSGEWKHRLKDGRIIDAEMTSRVIELEGTKAALVVTVDITDKKKAQNALAESENRFRLITETIQDVFWMSDPFMNRVFYISPAYETIWGRAPKSLYDSPESVLESIVPEDRQKYMYTIQLQSTGKAFSNEYRIITPTGEIRTILDRGFPVFDKNSNLLYFVGVARDISLRKKYEEEIKKLSVAVEQSPASIIITDLNANIEYVNDAFIKNTGYNRDEIIGFTPGVFQSGLVPREMFDNLWETITSGKTWKGVLSNRKKNGELIWESTSITPLADEKGQVTNYLAVNLDVTKEKQAEQKILQINEELEQKVITRTAELIQANLKLNELNATKDKFFSLIAHDLKNPFNSILSYSQLLTMNFEKLDSARITKNINTIRNSAESAFKLLENLLEWARSQTGKIDFKPQETELNYLFTTAIAATHTLAMNKKISVNIERVDEAIVFVDRNIINTVLRNLITNAIKFTPSGGLVDCCSFLERDLVIISVQDNGIGMDEETLSRLFKINEKVTRPGTNNERGTGLGLILCKEFVEMNGGKIWAETELGKGSVFKFSIPVYKPDTACN